MATGQFPTNFPNGPIVDPQTGLMAVGHNGTYFFLALFNRTGGPGGVPLTRQTAEGLTIDMLRRPADGPVTQRQPVNGLTIGMLNHGSR